MALHACWSVSVQGCGLSVFYGRLWLRLVVAARYILLYVCLWLFICADVSSLLALPGWYVHRCSLVGCWIEAFFVLSIWFPILCIRMWLGVHISSFRAVWPVHVRIVVATQCLMLPMWSWQVSLVMSCPGTLVFLVVIFWSCVRATALSYLLCATCFLLGYHVICGVAGAL